MECRFLCISQLQALLPFSYAGKSYRDKVSLFSLRRSRGSTEPALYRLLRLFMVKRLQKLPLFFVVVALGASYG